MSVSKSAAQAAACGVEARVASTYFCSVNEISRKFSQNAENAALNKHPIKVSPSEIVWKVHYWQADLKIFATRTARR